MGSRGSSYRIVGKDLVQNLPANIVTSSGYFGIITANPAYWSGTRIAAIASAYQSYTINKFTVEYVPQVSVGYNGTVIMGTKWDNGAITSMQQQSLYTSPGGRMTAVYDKTSSSVPLTGLQMRRFNMAGDLSATTNPFVFMAAVRAGYLAYQGSGDTPVVPGYFVVHYDYTLHNPIGSGWSYQTNYAVSLEQVDELASTTVLLAQDVSPYGAGTYFDYTGGSLSWQGTPVSIPSTTLVNVYANGPIANEDLPETVAVTGQAARIVDKIQFRNGADQSWQDCPIYKVGAGLYQGVPGYSSAYFGIHDLGIGPENDRDFNLTAWHGVKSISLQNAVGWFTQMPDPSRTGQFRVGTKVVGRHSSIVPVQNWNVLDILSGDLLDHPNSLIYTCTNVVFPDEKDESEMETSPLDDDVPQDWVPLADNTNEVRAHMTLLKRTLSDEGVLQEQTITAWSELTPYEAGAILEPYQSYLLIAKYWPTVDVPYRIFTNGPARVSVNEVQKKTWHIFNNPGLTDATGAIHPTFALPASAGRVTLFGRLDNGALTISSVFNGVTYHLTGDATPQGDFIYSKSSDGNIPMTVECHIKYESPVWSMETDFYGYFICLITAKSVSWQV